ncbi:MULTISPECIES: hypothetical protein [Companilactobacillus]|uniref:hypothetical protein n=1 Tax=Companilactobacillus TaxID=2767879 RepID=UPI002FF275C6
MFTREQILNAARNAGIEVSSTPDGMEPSFVSSNGDRFPIMDDKIILDNFVDKSYLESELLIEHSSIDIDNSLIIDNSFDLLIGDLSSSTKYKNNVSENKFHESVNNYKDFTKKGSPKQEILFYCVNISL